MAAQTCLKVELPSAANETLGAVHPVLEKYETALLLLLGFGGASIILAILHRTMRAYVFKDADNVDTTFDAGGRVSTSLTAVTVASQFLWPGDLLQSSTIAVKSGISGPLWYTVGAAVNIALFPIVSVYLKTRAPGAKTFLQIMYARYGKPAHVIFIVMALLVNLCVISAILIAGVDITRSYTTEASDEFCVLIIAILFGCYSFVGGLGTTFYVSYFNAVLIFAILITLNIKILYSPDDSTSLGSFEKIYSKLDCLLAPEGNQDRSYLTFKSENGLVWAFMGLCVTASLTYCDQAAWQSRVAAKPVQGVLGFLIASFIWFAIPISISTSAGLAYLAMGADNGTNVLPLGEIDKGLVTPMMAQRLLGDGGGVLILTLVAMTVMSTGSGEVMAVSSIIVYDIYQVYINPFRSKRNNDNCILCDKLKLKECPQSTMAGPGTTASVTCTCPNVAVCTECQQDEARNSSCKQNYKRSYQCQFHAPFRQYQDSLFRYKSWCILWVTICIVPLGLGIIASGIDLNWAMLFGFIITLPCFPPVVLAIFWSKTSAAGVISGAVFGVVCGVSVALGIASTYEGGLTEFLINSVQNQSVLGGAATSIGVSFITTVLISAGTNSIKTGADIGREWQKLRDIDNPLHPWCEIYEEDVPDLKKGERPTPEELEKVFRRAKILAYVGGAIILVLFCGVIPGVMVSLDVLTVEQFRIWTNVLQIFCFAMAGIVVIAAPVEEVVQVCRQHAANKLKKRATDLDKHSYDMPKYTSRNES